MPIEIRQQEQQLSSELKPIDTTSSPDIGNTNVVGSQMSVTPENVESVCNGLSPILNQLNRFFV